MNRASGAMALPLPAAAGWQDPSLFFIITHAMGMHGERLAGAVQEGDFQIIANHATKDWPHNVPAEAQADTWW